MATHKSKTRRFISRDMLYKIPKQDLKRIRWPSMQFGHRAYAVFFSKSAYALNLSIFVD